MYLIISRIEDSATAELLWASLLETLYIIFYAYWGSFGIYPDNVSRM